MLAWRISERPGFTRVELQGEIDDGVDLAALARRLAGPVRLHLGEVRQVSPLGLRGWLAGFAFTGVPPVVAYTNLATAALELLLVLGLLRRRRAAWAFALSLEGTQLLVNLLGMPQILHGASQLVSVLVVLARSTLFGFLVVASNEFRDIDDA